jgi:carboxyl-terminal processing protease
MVSFPTRFRVPCLLATGLLTAVTGGCGGNGDGAATAGSGGGTAAPCDESTRKQWVLDVAREWYLFPELLPAGVQPGAYPNAEALLDALTAAARSQGKDRFFSYLTTREAENSLLGEGEFVGFGFRNRVDPGNRPFILDVFASSPAADAGLARGDEIVAIDAGRGFVPVAQSLAAGETVSDLLGPAAVGVQRGLRIARDAAVFDLTLVKRTVTIDPVPDDFGATILPLAGTTGVGYLHLRTYTATADAQLRAAFMQFQAQHQELQYFIVDLRYNGGGFVNTAELVNNLLGGSRTAADTQFRYVYNTTKAAQNSTIRFQPQTESVRPVRVVFLTTEATASASEININSLEPWLEIAIVGSDTFGKPVGQLAFDLTNCPDRLRLTAFRTVNARDVGDYYDGLAPTLRFACAAADTLDAPLGTVDDNLTRAALAWLGSGACEALIAPGASAAMKPQDAAAGVVRRQPTPAERWLPGTH